MIDRIALIKSGFFTAFIGVVTALLLIAFSGCNSIGSVVVPGWKCGIDFSSVTNLMISEGVTSIESFAFSGCNGLTSVTIPSSVASIGERAFYGSGLKKLRLPESGERIGEWAFCRCDALETADLKHIRALGRGAFELCESLKEVHFSHSLQKYDCEVFHSCPQLSVFGPANSEAENCAREFKLPFVAE